MRPKQVVSQAGVEAFTARLIEAHGLYSEVMPANDMVNRFAAKFSVALPDGSQIIGGVFLTKAISDDLWTQAKAASRQTSTAGCTGLPGYKEFEEIKPPQGFDSVFGVEIKCTTTEAIMDGTVVHVRSGPFIYKLEFAAFLHRPVAAASERDIADLRGRLVQDFLRQVNALK